MRDTISKASVDNSSHIVANTEMSSSNNKGEIPKIITDLENLLPNLPEKRRQAAQYFLNHPDHVAFMSLRKICIAARVSTGSVMKLLKTLGYSSFDTFKLEFQHWVTGKQNHFTNAVRQTKHTPGHDGTLLSEIAQNDIRNIQNTVSADTVQSLQNAAKLAVSARKVFVVGLRVTASVAHYISYQLGFIRPDVYFLDDQNELLIDNISDMSSEDVLIAISFFPYTRKMVDVVEYAKSTGTRVISFTDADESPITAPNGETLIFAVESPWIYNSLTSGFMLAQAFVANALAESGDAAFSRIRDRDKILQKFRVFTRS